MSSPRTHSVTGSVLPSEREVASAVLVDRDDPDQHFTLSVMQWAQFIDHDLTHAPFSSLSESRLQRRQRALFQIRQCVLSLEALSLIYR